jgi:hypothetical protein
VCSISGTTVWRYLAADAIRPSAWRSWIFPREPHFAEKAGRVLDLYERRWQGQLLHPGDFVISVDEKSQLQALLGRHYPRRSGPAGQGSESSSTRASGRWPISPRSTCMTPSEDCSGATKRRPPSSGSAGSSNRS